MIFQTLEGHNSGLPDEETRRELYSNLTLITVLINEETIN